MTDLMGLRCRVKDEVLRMPLLPLQENDRDAAVKVLERSWPLVDLFLRGRVSVGGEPSWRVAGKRITPPSQLCILMFARALEERGEEKPKPTQERERPVKRGKMKKLTAGDILVTKRPRAPKNMTRIV